MLFGLFGRRIPESRQAVYGAIVAQARQPAFYLDHAVPDTVEGRFEMILVHATLMFHRLGREAPATRAAAQDVLDIFFTDMDRNLRELGVGDLSVGKKMKKLGMAYAGRSQAYSRAIAAGDAVDLAAAVLRNVFRGDAGAAAPAGRVAAYMLAATERLDGQSADDLIEARIAWPDPAAYAASQPHAAAPDPVSGAATTSVSQP